MVPNTVTEITSYDPTVLFYTFSTIAQTLAASFAFVGAFVLFRIRDIEQTIKGIAEAILLLGRYRRVLQFKINLQQWEVFVDELTYRTIQQEIDDYRRNYISKHNEDQFKKHEEELQREAEEAAWNKMKDRSPCPFEMLYLNTSKSNLITNFKYTAITSVINIIASLILLMFTLQLCSHCLLYWGSLALIVVLSIISIGFCLKLILNVFQRPAFSENLFDTEIEKCKTRLKSRNQ